MNIYEKAKIFIEETHVGKTPSTIRDNLRRLNEAVNIFEQNGITAPTEADFENILRPAIAAKGKKAGEQAQEKTIRRTLSLARKFYQNLKLKGEIQMNDNEFTTNNEQNEQADFSPEASIVTAENNASEISEAKPEQKTQAPKRGRKTQTGREEKFTLYMTKERMENLRTLTKNRKITITDLLNNLIDEYCKKQSRYLEAVRELEKKGEALEALLVD